MIKMYTTRKNEPLSEDVYESRNRAMSIECRDRKSSHDMKQSKLVGDKQSELL